MSGVVLAGGASRRMGRDKATLVVGGETLLARAARCLAQAGADPVRVATGAAGRLGDLPWPELGDGAHAGAGPLAGVLAALRASEGTSVVVAVLAVDLPEASAGVFRWLRTQWRPEDSALVPVDHDGRSQPLHGLVSASPIAVAELERHLGAGERRVQRVLAAMGTRHVAIPPSVAPAGWSINWNTVGDGPGGERGGGDAADPGTVDL